MLILRTKIVFVDGQPVTLYSLDGKLWFSSAHDMLAFKRRRITEKARLQRTLALQDMSGHIAGGIVDFWAA